MLRRVCWVLELAEGVAGRIRGGSYPPEAPVTRAKRPAISLSIDITQDVCDERRLDVSLQNIFGSFETVRRVLQVVECFALKSRMRGEPPTLSGRRYECPT